MSVLSSAFRTHYGCEHVLTKLIEDCKHAIYEHQNVGLILLDLRKAFDCLPHRPLLCKLRAYGVSYESCKLIKSYLCNRLQRVKISEWAILAKGVPQGSVLGLLLFNIFLGDIFYSLKNVCSLYNYADDNSISCYSHDMNVLKEQLEANAKLALDWFAEKQMKANPSKFQTNIFKHRSNEAICELNISNYTIEFVWCVKWVGITLDGKLCFDDHISRSCTRADRQTNALRWIVKYVPLDCRINIYNAFMASNFNYC